MANWRRITNLFYYNVFRFECAAQYALRYPVKVLLKILGIYQWAEKKSDISNVDAYVMGVLNDPRGGMSLQFAGLQITLLSVLLCLSLLNFVCGFLTLGLHTFWFYGMLLACSLGILFSYYVAPTNRSKFLADFKKFGSMSKVKKRKAALITFLIYIGIWSVFILSSIFYLRSLHN